MWPMDSFTIIDLPAHPLMPRIILRKPERFNQGRSGALNIVIKY